MTRTAAIPGDNPEKARIRFQSYAKKIDEAIGHFRRRLLELTREQAVDWKRNPNSVWVYTETFYYYLERMEDILEGFMDEKAFKRVTQYRAASVNRVALAIIRRDATKEKKAFIERPNY